MDVGDARSTGGNAKPVKGPESGRTAFAGLREDALRSKASPGQGQRGRASASQDSSSYTRLRSGNDQGRRAAEIGFIPAETRSRESGAFARLRGEAQQPKEGHPISQPRTSNRWSPLASQDPSFSSTLKSDTPADASTSWNEQRQQQQPLPRRAKDWTALRSIIEKGQQEEEAVRVAQQQRMNQGKGQEESKERIRGATQIKGLSRTSEENFTEQLYSAPVDSNFALVDNKHATLSGWSHFVDAKQSDRELLVRRYSLKTPQLANQFAMLFHTTEILTRADFPSFVGIFDQGGAYAVQVELGGSKPVTTASIFFAKQCDGLYNHVDRRHQNENHEVYKEAMVNDVAGQSADRGHNIKLANASNAPFPPASSSKVTPSSKLNAADFEGLLLRPDESSREADVDDKVGRVLDGSAVQSGSPDADHARIDDIVPVAIDGDQVELHGEGQGGTEMAKLRHEANLDDATVDGRVGSILQGTAPVSNSSVEDEARIDDVVPVAVEGQQVMNDAAGQGVGEAAEQRQHPEAGSSSPEDKIGSVLDGTSAQSGSPDEDKARIDDVVPVEIDGKQVPQKSEGSGAHEMAEAREKGIQST